MSIKQIVDSLMEKYCCQLIYKIEACLQQYKVRTYSELFYIFALYLTKILYFFSPITILLQWCKWRLPLYFLFTPFFFSFLHGLHTSGKFNLNFCLTIQFNFHISRNLCFWCWRCFCCCIFFFRLLCILPDDWVCVCECVCAFRRANVRIVHAQLLWASFMEIAALLLCRT